MKNKLYLEDVHSIALEAFALIEKRLKEYDIHLQDGIDDEIYVPIEEAIEKVSNGNYRHEH